METIQRPASLTLTDSSRFEIKRKGLEAFSALYREYCPEDGANIPLARGILRHVKKVAEGLAGGPPQGEIVRQVVNSFAAGMLGALGRNDAARQAALREYVAITLERGGELSDVGEALVRGSAHLCERPESALAGAVEAFEAVQESVGAFLSAKKAERKPCEPNVPHEPCDLKPADIFLGMVRAAPPGAELLVESLYSLWALSANAGEGKELGLRGRQAAVELIYNVESPKGKGADAVKMYLAFQNGCRAISPALGNAVLDAYKENSFQEERDLRTLTSCQLEEASLAICAHQGRRGKGSAEHFGSEAPPAEFALFPAPVRAQLADFIEMIALEHVQ